MYTKLMATKKKMTTSSADLNPPFFHREKFMLEFFRFDERIQQICEHQDADN
jgi:hypothetical protein